MIKITQRGLAGLVILLVVVTLSADGQPQNTNRKSPSVTTSSNETNITIFVGDNYMIKKGDTLDKIACEYGNDTVSEIVKRNDIKDRNKIVVGQVISLGKPQCYTWVAGIDDTYTPIRANPALIELASKGIKFKPGGGECGISDLYVLTSQISDAMPILAKYHNGKDRSVPVMK